MSEFRKGNGRQVSMQRYWLATASLSVLCGALLAPGSVAAQTTEKPAASSVEEVVITGSRIRRSTDTQSPAPVAVIGGDAVAEKGYTQVGQVLKELPSNNQVRSVSPTLSNGQNVIAQDYPNLFSLGASRTLTLLNGRRMPATSSGLGDEATDSNIIPTGLLDRVDVVQGGGAAVYGSGAIAGVVNYVLKDDFDGAELQAQLKGGIDGNYQNQSVRAMFGRNFFEERANIAVQLDYSSNNWLATHDRLDRFPGGLVAPNPMPGAGTNGIPATINIPFQTDGGYTRFFSDVNGAVLSAINTLNPALAPKIGANNITIDSSGNIVPRYFGVAISNQVRGAELPDLRLLNGTLVPPVARKIASIVGHFDLTDHIKISSEVLASRVDATSKYANYVGFQFHPAFGAIPRWGPIPFLRTNAYLTPATVSQLSALVPAFANGQPLYLSKQIYSPQLSSKYLDSKFRTQTVHAVVTLSGDFSQFDRNFYWDASFAKSEVQQTNRNYAPSFPNLYNATNAVRNSSGQIVCAINAVTVTDPACKPMNIFGTAPFDQEALDYVFKPSGMNVTSAFGEFFNTQEDFLATFSGDLIRLPGGEAKFSTSYEHRDATAKFQPKRGDQDGIFVIGTKALASKGGYKTDEFAGEVEIPLLGGSFSLPFVKALDFAGSYRYVDNSLAGTDGVWSAGLRWQVGYGLLLRGTKSKNFRAPSIAQATAPAASAFQLVQHPCSRNFITQGVAPATRAANCLAVFTANPTFGLIDLPAGVANTPANRLAAFLPGNVATTAVQISGNPDLRNEVSDTTTFGVVFQPPFVPGLVISADVLRLDLKDAITLFSGANFANTCYDTSPMPAEFCDTLGYETSGRFATAKSQAVNAGASTLHAEVYNIDYRFPLSDISDRLSGNMNLVVQATHNTLQTTTFVGVTTRTDGTIALPTWVTRFDARYRNGPFGVAYSLYYLPRALAAPGATVLNTADGLYKLKANMRHDITADYKFNDQYTVRVGVSNITNEMPSYPSFTYGDVIGTAAFISLTARL